jgi:membrane protein DedA with SNARE-associated domain
VVAIGRMFAGIRGAMVVVAGATHFKLWKFIVADGLAAIVSGGLFLYLGFVFGNHIHQLNEHVHTAKRYMLAIIVGLALILAGFIWWKSRQEHDSEDEPQSDPPLPQSNIVPQNSVE